MNINNTRKALGFIIDTLDTHKSKNAIIKYGEAKKEFFPSDEKYFERVTPEECGIPSGHTKEFVKALKDDKTVGLQSISISRNGKIFFEADVGNWDSRLPKATFSECKSILSLAIGVLVTQGRLRLSERLADIFPEKTSPVSKIRLKNVTVKMLLNMTSCVTFNELEAMVKSDWVKEFLNSDTDGSVGKEFRYNSLNSYLLSAIIKEKTGYGLSEFLDMTLFKVLCIKDYYWEKCPLGIEKGGWGLYIRKEDIIKLGLLVMQKGEWNGKRLISPKYIEQAIKTQAEVPEEFGNFNYGYHIWSGRRSDSYLFNGMLGQNLLGYKRNGIIIAVNCANYDTFQQNAFFDIADKFFDREFNSRLPENEPSYRQLSEYKAELGKVFSKRSILPVVSPCRKLTDDLNALDGRIFSAVSSNAVSIGFAPSALQIIQSNYSTGLKAVKFTSVGGRLNLDFIEKDATYSLPVGIDAPIMTCFNINGEYYSVNAQGKFSENEYGVGVLTVECNFLETPYARTYKFYFDEEESFAIFSETPGIQLAKNANALITFLAPNAKKLESIIAKLDKDYISIKLERVFSAKITLEEHKEKGS